MIYTPPPTLMVNAPLPPAGVGFKFHGTGVGLVGEDKIVIVPATFPPPPPPPGAVIVMALAAAVSCIPDM
jgi:hypothetical protein